MDLEVLREVNLGPSEGSEFSLRRGLDRRARATIGVRRQTPPQYTYLEPVHSLTPLSSHEVPHPSPR